MTVEDPPAKVPSYKVEVEYGIAPFEHLVVIQGSLSGKQVDCSIQWPGCQTDGKNPCAHSIGGSWLKQ
ncbi:hypothetical protein N7475_007910 [Penicillium sp. IBT 31633x]|nr:hypothetical protein N7475_007910 [Penicillium sp. IBT 31633x]